MEIAGLVARPLCKKMNMIEIDCTTMKSDKYNDCTMMNSDKYNDCTMMNSDKYNDCTMMNSDKGTLLISDVDIILLTFAYLSKSRHCLLI